MKTHEQGEARRLRQEEGASVKEIARRLCVSRSSVSRWVRDIELTPTQHAVLRARNPIYNQQLAGHARMAEKARRVRSGHQDAGRALARRRDPIHAAGVMLYWAEGDKTRNAVRFSNSDPELARFFVAFLRTYFDVRDDDIAITCNLFADHSDRQREIEDFWLAALHLPRTSLRKSVVNVYSKHSQKKRRNKLPYGTVKIVIGRTSIVQSIYGAIQEYAGFTREEWLG